MKLCKMQINCSMHQKSEVISVEVLNIEVKQVSNDNQLHDKQFFSVGQQ